MKRLSSNWQYFGTNGAGNRRSPERKKPDQKVELAKSPRPPQLPRSGGHPGRGHHLDPVLARRHRLRRLANHHRGQKEGSQHAGQGHQPQSRLTNLKNSHAQDDHTALARCPYLAPQDSNTAPGHNDPSAAHRENSINLQNWQQQVDKSPHPTYK